MVWLQAITRIPQRKWKKHTCITQETILCAREKITQIAKQPETMHIIISLGNCGGGKGWNTTLMSEAGDWSLSSHSSWDTAGKSWNALCISLKSNAHVALWCCGGQLGAHMSDESVLRLARWERLEHCCYPQDMHTAARWTWCVGFKGSSKQPALWKKITARAF